MKKRNEKSVLPRFMVFPSRSEEDGRKWIVRDTLGAVKPEAGKIVQAMRTLSSAIAYARQKNGLTR